MDDLKAACAELADENGLSEPKQFEVGVFCGNYVTPVAEGYFQHLEEVRGEGRRMKVMESARKAVLGGVASQDDLQVAVNGVNVDKNGKVVPAAAGGFDSKAEQQSANYLSHDPDDQAEKPPQVKERMDISLHNLGDYT